MAEFNLFGNATTNDIRVAYISTERGLVDNVTVCEANDYAKLNPGTQFIFQTREFTKYMNINGVNKLTPDDLLPKKECEGVQMTKECGPPAAYFSGGGGIGIKGNPIIGQDGAVLAIDLVSGGFGFQSPPHIDVKDNCGIGAGGNFRAELGELIEKFEYYDLEEDFEEYEICEGATDTGVFGDRYGINGENLGPWEPKMYANFKLDPLRKEIKKYQDLLALGTNPFWSTRKQAPLSVTGEKGTSRIKYDVDHSAWSGFMNEHAISPKPKSNVSGSDFAGIPYSFVWEEDFPYDGEYVFRGAKDNKAEFYLDGVFVSKLDHFKGGLNPIKKTMKAGIHQIRLDLLNVPIKEKVIIQADSSGNISGDSPTQDIVYVGLHGANKPIRVSDDHKRILLKDGHGNDTNCSLNITSGDLRFSSDGKKIIGPGSSTIVMNWKDKSQAGRAVNSIKIGSLTWVRKGTRGSQTNLVTLDPPPPPLEKKASTESQELETHKVFNTIDYIEKANRPLWRTNVYNRGGFINEYGVCPFDTRVNLEDNPYAGTHTIIWNNVQFPIDGNYDIGVQVDDNVKLTIDGRGKTEVIEKIGFAADTDTSTGKSAYVRSFLKGAYTITAELEQKAGGRFGFDNSVINAPTRSSVDIIYSGLHRVNNPITVTNGGKRIELRDGHGGDTNASFQITSGDATFSSDGRRIEGTGAATITLWWKDRRTAGRAVNSIRIGSTTWRRKGTRGSQTQVVPVSNGVKGINPMALAINIQTVFTEKEVISAKSWNENPMGIALTIDSPEPPIPQEQLPEAPGRCPRNPMWTTRHPHADKKWYPVRFNGWSPFLNRFAMSPVAPRGDVSSDAGGIVFTNSWKEEIPYNGWYKLKAEADDIARIYVNGDKKIDLSRRNDKIRGENKFFLSKGETEIKVEVENYQTQTFNVIDKKIFNTADWVIKHKPPSTGGLEIIYTRLGYKNKPIHVDDDRKTIRLEQAAAGRGHHLCWVMSITSGDGEFSEDGMRLLGEGAVSINVKYASQAGKPHEYAVDSVKIGDKKWVRPDPRRSGGKVRSMARLDETHIINIPAEKKSISQTGGTSRDGVVYEGPELASYIKGALGPALTPKWDLTGDKIIDDQYYRDEFMDKSWTSIWTNVDFPEDGQYQIQCMVDDTLTVKVDGNEIVKAQLGEQVPGNPSFNEAEYLKYGETSVKTVTFNATKGRRTIEAIYYNIPGNQSNTFYTNPVHFSFKITKKVSISTGAGKSWLENPVGVAAALIPPPCPKKISGKGTITQIIVDDPGNGFPKPHGAGYPVGLGLSAINIKDAGINYNCAIDTVRVEPSNGAKLSLVCDNFGRISKVVVDDPGLGFTTWPQIIIDSDTGINFEATPIFQIIRDPIVVDPDKLVQVTDLAGIKQTGYYQGRPYYGAVFYKDNIRYAGWYETPGQLVQIYDTLQESIDAEVTTPPSAILRQGSDVSSNDPKLNLPGTPENLT